MSSLLRDFTYAARTLRRSPGFLAAAVLTLALGIGANTAIFSLVNATLLQPLPIPHPERVVSFSWSSSYPDFSEYRSRTDVFAGVAGIAMRDRLALSAEGITELRGAAFISGGGFEALGVGAAVGRTLQPADDEPGSALAGMLGYDYWRLRFGGRDDVVGRTMEVNGHPFTIVGVAQQGFRGTSLASNPQVFLPLPSATRVSTGFFALPGLLTNRGASWLTVFGRLAPAVTVEQATAAMDAQYRQQHPPPAGSTVERLSLMALNTRALGDSAEDVRRFLFLLAGVVGMTLLVGCANLANLLLARIAGRRREIAVRLALGAGRGGVTRQLLAESVLLALAGGIAGLAVAPATLRLLTSFELPGGITIGTLPLDLDGRALAATAALSIATGLVFGAAPAWRASRSDVLVALRDGRGSTTPGTLRAVLLGVQVALCVVLLAGGGLFLRSLVNALDRPLGYQPRGAVIASVNLALAGFDRARADAFYDEATLRLRALPAVTAVAWTSAIPTRGGMSMDAQPEGYAAAHEEDMHFGVAQVGDEYFAAAGTRIIEGRPFDASDTARSMPVAVINETAARRFYGGRALGRRIRIAEKDPWITIVGIAEDTVIGQLSHASYPYMYFPFTQQPETRRMGDARHLLVRTERAEALVSPVASELRGIDRAAPIYDVRPFDEAVAGLVMPQRMGVVLLGCFGLLALTLASVGIYGVAAYNATLRTREIGIRLALGSSAGSIRSLVTRHGVRPVAAGIACGSLLAIWAGPLAAGFLYGVSPSDPVTLAAVAVVLGGVAVAATYLPARRASRTDPMVALRVE